VSEPSGPFAVECALIVALAVAAVVAGAWLHGSDDRSPARRTLERTGLSVAPLLAGLVCAAWHEDLRGRTPEDAPVLMLPTPRDFSTALFEARQLRCIGVVAGVGVFVSLTVLSRRRRRHTAPREA
jgi:hypothetical protein